MSESDFSHQIAKLTGGVVRDPTIPRFHVQVVPMDYKSKQAGRPIYEEQEFVEIIVPGNRRSTACEPVNESHKARWPEIYAAFKDGREAPTTGTALAVWPNSLLNRARVEELAYFHIRTVEDLAAVSDANLANLGMGAREIRAAAQKFLEVAAKGTAPIERMLAENFALKDELGRANKSIAEQAEIISALRAQLREVTHAGA